MRGFTIVSQLGGDGAYLLTDAGACIPLERPPGSRTKRITRTLVAPGVVSFSPSIAERGIGGPAISFLLDGGSDVSSVGAGFEDVLVDAVLTLVFGGEWAHARRRLQLPFGDFSDRRTLALVYPAGTPLGELPKEGGVLEGGACWVRSKVSKAAWNRRSKLPRQAHGALVRDFFLIADHLNVSSQA